MPWTALYNKLLRIHCRSNVYSCSLGWSGSAPCAESPLADGNVYSQRPPVFDNLPRWMTLMHNSEDDKAQAKLLRLSIAGLQLWNVLLVVTMVVKRKHSMFPSMSICACSKWSAFESPYIFFFISSHVFILQDTSSFSELRTRLLLPPEL